MPAAAAAGPTDLPLEEEVAEDADAPSIGDAVCGAGAGVRRSVTARPLLRTQFVVGLAAADGMAVSYGLMAAWARARARTSQADQPEGAF